MNKTLVVFLSVGIISLFGMVGFMVRDRSAPPACWDAPFEALDADDLSWSGIAEGTPMVCAKWFSLGEDRKLGTGRRFLLRCWPGKPMSEKVCRQVPPVRKTP